MESQGWIDGVEGVLLDVDGTLLDGIHAIPGAGAALDRLRRAGIPFRLVTNTTRKPRVAIARTLHEAGIEVRPEEILVPATLAGRLVRDSGKLRVMPLVPEACLDDLIGEPAGSGAHGARTGQTPPAVRSEAGPRPVPLHESAGGVRTRGNVRAPRGRGSTRGGNTEGATRRRGSSGGEPGICVEEAAPDWVVVGDLGAGFTFERLNRAFQALKHGARLLALHRGRSWRNESGEVVLDAGPFVAALEYAAGVEARLVGKPARAFFDLAAAEIGIEPGRLMMVGDDWTNDIEGGADAGLVTVLVLTGNASRHGGSGAGGAARSTASNMSGANRAGRHPSSGSVPGHALEGGAAHLVLDSIADLAFSDA